MPSGDVKSLSALGFLTVIEHEQNGLFGGYLILNAAGRPLEFHCTAPIKPNRAQQILYGPTLGPYLYGEQIGQALVGKAKTDVRVVITDAWAVLALREFVSTPVVLLLPEPDASGRSPAPALRSAGESMEKFAHFTIGRHALAVAEAYADDREQLAGPLEQVAATIHLGEPFQRIREAITEANRTAA